MGSLQDGGILIVKIESKGTEVCFTTDITYTKDGTNWQFVTVDISASPVNPLERKVRWDDAVLDEQGWFGEIMASSNGTITIYASQPATRCEKVEFFKKGNIVEGYIVYKNASKDNWGDAEG